MTEQNWEYCELRLDNAIEQGGLFSSGQGYSYDCSIRYYTVDGKFIYIELSNTNQPMSYNPFSRAMAFLGANGWELVSVQTGDPMNFMGWRHKVAFLKRSIVTGRKVNEPELKF
jgi:hypothetical protein